MRSNLAYLEDYPQELIGGEVVMMSPAAPQHNRLAFKIAVLFENYLKGKKCVPFSDGTAVHLTDDDCFIPDGMVVCDRSKITPKWVEGAPDLVWEVLSPSTAKNDRWQKKNVYEACGVPEYWIVDPAGRSVEVYLLIDGRYVLSDVYFHYTDEERADMTAEEQAALVTEFRCHLFDDLAIPLADIFGDML